MRRTFILHARTAKLPSDLLGLTSVRYGDATNAAEVKTIIKKLQDAIGSQGRMSRIEGLWWEFALTERSVPEPSVISLLRISRARSGALDVVGRSWREDGTLSARYWSEATKERTEVPGIFYYFRGERPRDPNAPKLEGTAEILLESADRGAGYYNVRSDVYRDVELRTSGVYLRAEPDDERILDSSDRAERAALIAERIESWKEIVNT